MDKGLEKRLGAMHEIAEPVPVFRNPITRNHPCPCGSGMKFKRCCGRHVEPPKTGSRFDEMTSQQRREFQNGLAAILEANLPPGDSLNGRAFFTIIVWDGKYAGYVSNADRSRQAESLRIAAEQMDLQGGCGVIDYTSGVIPPARSMEALERLYYACHAMVNPSREAAEDIRENYNQALREAGIIVNEGIDHVTGTAVDGDQAGDQQHAERSTIVDADQGQEQSAQ